MSNAPDNCRRITLTLVALPDRPGDAPAIVRLRRLLKSILRVAGWRCVEATPDGPTERENPGGRVAEIAWAHDPKTANPSNVHFGKTFPNETHK